MAVKYFINKSSKIICTVIHKFITNCEPELKKNIKSPEGKKRLADLHSGQVLQATGICCWQDSHSFLKGFPETRGIFVQAPQQATNIFLCSPRSQLPA